MRWSCVVLAAVAVLLAVKGRADGIRGVAAGDLNGWVGRTLGDFNGGVEQTLVDQTFREEQKLDDFNTWIDHTPGDFKDRIGQTVSDNGREQQNAARVDPDHRIKMFTQDLQEWFRDEGEGRHFKRRKMMLRMAMWLKTLGLGVVLPAAVALALFAAWKGITISLMALLLSGIVGLKGLVSSAAKASSAGSSLPQHVVLSGVPSHHQHYWKRIDPSGDSSTWSDSHQLAYSAYT